MGLADTSLTAAVVVFILCFSAAAPLISAKKLTSFSKQYANFTDVVHYNTLFQVERPATINNDALQITPDSASDDFNLTYQSGRIFHHKKFKLWDSVKNTSRIASFNVSFLVNLYRLPNTSSHGEGFAFAIAPDLNLPRNSHGQYLGLTNSTTDGKTSNGIVAVELDTFKNAFDPDGNHLGLNLNTVKSSKTVSLTPLGIELIPDYAAFYNVWIQYDGVRKSIEVYIANQSTKTGPTPPRPKSPLLRSDLDLRNFVHQYSYFGFSASTSNVTQLNCVLRWNLTVDYYPHSNGSLLKILLGVGIPAMAILLIGGALVGYFLRKRKVDRSNSNILGALKSLPGTPREFRFRDLKKATGNFDEKNKLGQGGYGVVYRGFLQNENLEVAVKWFSRGNLKGEDDFLAELTIINRLRHKHLVRLLGWCHKNGKLLLVYDYMPNGSLDQHLFGGSESRPLTWNLRYKIITGVASALHYLHNEYDQRVVHRDLKASNIMLESDFNARLGDFGLARALDNEKTSYAEAEGVLGTMGYIAPECFHTGKATRQSDVYAFGAVVLEVVCGVRPGTKIGPFQFLVDWVWSLHRDGRLLEAVDERLGEGYVVEEAQRLLLLGLACMHPMAGERPKSQSIVQILSGSVAAPTVPPFKPSFVWPSMPMGEDDLSLCTTPDTRSLTTSHFESGWSPKSISRENYGPYSDNNSLV